MYVLIMMSPLGNDENICVLLDLCQAAHGSLIFEIASLVHGATLPSRARSFFVACEIVYLSFLFLFFLRFAGDIWLWGRVLRKVN